MARALTKTIGTPWGKPQDIAVPDRSFASTTKAATTPDLDVTNGANSIWFGHVNTAYNGILGAFSGSGVPFIGAHFYHSSTNNELRRSGTNGPSSIWFDIAGGMSFYADAAGTLDATLNPTQVGSVSSAGVWTLGPAPVDNTYDYPLKHGRWKPMQRSVTVAASNTNVNFAIMNVPGQVNRRWMLRVTAGGMTTADSAAATYLITKQFNNDDVKVYTVGSFASTPANLQVIGVSYNGGTNQILFTQATTTTNVGAVRWVIMADILDADSSVSLDDFSW